MAVDRSIVERAARLTREKIAPRAATFDRDAVNPVDSWRDLWSEEFLAAAVPRAYGGFELDMPTYVAMIRSVAGGCASTAMTLHMHSTVLRFIAALGTDEHVATSTTSSVAHAPRELGQRARGEPVTHVSDGDGDPARRQRLRHRWHQALLHDGTRCLVLPDLVRARGRGRDRQVAHPRPSAGRDAGHRHRW